MRFQLPVTSWNHPAGHAIRKVVAHPEEKSWIISSCHGNNEVDVWDMESGEKKNVFWASQAPPLSQQKVDHTTSTPLLVPIVCFLDVSI